jgi:hypothetical protein
MAGLLLVLKLGRINLVRKILKIKLKIVFVAKCMRTTVGMFLYLLN